MVLRRHELWILFAIAFVAAAAAGSSHESVVEEAVVSPLPDGLTLVRTHFTLTAPSGAARHVSVFPKAVGQLAAGIPFERLELALTQGRWHYQRWGEPLLQAKPAGAELRAAFSPLLPPEALPPLWGNLSHAVGGLLCASLNFVARAEATAPQAISMHPVRRQPGSSSSGSADGWAPGGAHQHVLYAALPQEASCTENLTPWLKLLPCRDAAGVGRLLSQRDVVFGADYHSLQLVLEVARDAQQRPQHTSLVLSFDMVLRAPPDSSSIGSSIRQPPRPGTLSDVDLTALLGASVPSACPVAAASRLHLRLPGALLLQPDQEQQWALQPPPVAGGDGSSSSSSSPGRAPEWATPAFVLQPAPDAAAVSGGAGGSTSAQHVLYTWDLARSSSSSSSDEAGEAAEASAGAAAAAPFILTWQRPAAEGSMDALLPGWQPPAAAGAGPVFAVSRYVTGTGNLHGGMVLQLSAVNAPDSSSSSGNVSVCVFQVVPWYVRLWLHTLELQLDGQAVQLDDSVLLSHISTAEDRRQPLVLDLCLSVPAATRSIVLTAQFTKAFLMMLEHPPDAHRGFDVPAAIITVGNVAAPAACSNASCSASSAPSAAGGAGSGADWRVVAAAAAAAGQQQQQDEVTPLMQALVRRRPRQVYSPGLVVTLAVPDFSMPYNVICLTSTVLAIFVGGVLNALLWRPGKEERDAADVAAAAGRRRRKAARMVVLVTAFSALAVYFDSDLQEELVKQLRALGLLAEAPAETHAGGLGL